MWYRRFLTLGILLLLAATVYGLWKEGLPAGLGKLFASDNQAVHTLDGSTGPDGKPEDLMLAHARDRVWLLDTSVAGTGGTLTLHAETHWLKADRGNAQKGIVAWLLRGDSMYYRSYSRLLISPADGAVQEFFFTTDDFLSLAGTVAPAAEALRLESVSLADWLPTGGYSLLHVNLATLDGSQHTKYYLVCGPDGKLLLAGLAGPCQGKPVFLPKEKKLLSCTGLHNLETGTNDVSFLPATVALASRAGDGLVMVYDDPMLQKADQNVQLLDGTGRLAAAAKAGSLYLQDGIYQLPYTAWTAGSCAYLWDQQDNAVLWMQYGSKARIDRIPLDKLSAGKADRHLELTLGNDATGRLTLYIDNTGRPVAVVEPQDS